MQGGLDAFLPTTPDIAPISQSVLQIRYSGAQLPIEDASYPTPSQNPGYALPYHLVEFL